MVKKRKKLRYNQKKNLGFDRNARKAVPPLTRQRPFDKAVPPRLRLGGRTQLALEGAATLIT